MASKEQEGPDNFDKFLDTLLDKVEEWVQYHTWQIINWWYVSKYAPLNLWYSLQTYLDPLPSPDLGGKDMGMVEHALRFMTKKQSRREAWYRYHQYKWIVRPESIYYAMKRMKTAKDKKNMYMLTELNKVVLENYVALLAEIEIRRVYTYEELARTKVDGVFNAQVRQTYDAYIESLQ